jgi:hypothetical protein
MYECALDEIAAERVVSSRGRQVSRGVKQKMSNFSIRGSGKVPTKPSKITVIILGAKSDEAKASTPNKPALTGDEASATASTGSL